MLMLCVNGWTVTLCVCQCVCACVCVSMWPCWCDQKIYNKRANNMKKRENEPEMSAVVSKTWTAFWSWMRNHPRCMCKKDKEKKKISATSGGRSSSSRTNKKRNDNEKQTLKIGFFICIGKSNQANVKTPTRHMHNIKPTQRHPADSWLPTAGCQTCGCPMRIAVLLKVRQVTYTPGTDIQWERGRARASKKEACIKRTINERCAPHVWPYSWPLLMACVAPAGLCRVRLKIGNDLYCNGPGWHKGGSLLCPGVPWPWSGCSKVLPLALLLASPWHCEIFLFVCPAYLAVIHLSCVFINWGCIKSLVGSRQSSLVRLCQLSLHLSYCHPLLLLTSFIFVTVPAVAVVVALAVVVVFLLVHERKANV